MAWNKDGGPEVSPGCLEWFGRICLVRGSSGVMFDHVGGLEGAGISFDCPGKVVVGLEQYWWSWRISWLLRVIWESYTGSW